MGNISIQQVLTLVSAGQQLVAVGSATILQVKAFIQTLHPGLSDVDLNAILDAISAGAARHKALADADVAAAGHNG